MNNDSEDTLIAAKSYEIEYLDSEALEEDPEATLRMRRSEIDGLLRCAGGK